MKVGEIFIKCPSCNRMKNVNHKLKDIEVEVVCFCGKILKKKLKIK